MNKVLVELRQAWYDENNRDDLDNLSPRDIGYHVGLKAGLTLAMNIVNKHEKESNPVDSLPLGPNGL